jgi:hypothetical protein
MMDASFLDTYLAGPADAHVAAVAAATPRLAGIPAGIRLTLRGDYERALAAAEDAHLLAHSRWSWDQAYPHLAAESDPQTAAAERALDDAMILWGDYETALARALALPLAA